MGPPAGTGLSGKIAQIPCPIADQREGLLGNTGKHMGSVTVTIQNLEVIKVDLDKNVILVKGSVPGAKGSILKIKSSVKA